MIEYWQGFNGGIASTISVLIIFFCMFLWKEDKKQPCKHDGSIFICKTSQYIRGSYDINIKHELTCSKCHKRTELSNEQMERHLKMEGLPLSVYF